MILFQKKKKTLFLNNNINISLKKKKFFKDFTN
jgi:hypothetical protein